MKTLRIIANAEHPTGLVVDATTGETVLGVWAADVSLSPGNRPEAHLHLAVQQVDVTTDQVKWHGLEHIPIEALQAELARRAAHPPEVTG